MGAEHIVTAAGFWIGALLPFLYLPIFLFGINSISQFSLLLGLLAINALALIVGHDYPDGRLA